MNAHQLPGHLRLSHKRCVDTLCQRSEVWIKRTDDNTGMLPTHLVQANKMLAIERYQDACFHNGKCQYFLIRYCPPRLTAFMAGEHIMPQPPQFFNCWERKVLIGV